MNRPPLIKYYRNPETRQLIGCVVFVDIGTWGWAQCHSRDNFDKKLAVRIAMERANKWKNLEQIPEPPSKRIRTSKGTIESWVLFNDTVETLFERSQRYFMKGEE